MKKIAPIILLISLISFSCMNKGKKAIVQPKYTADWESLKQHATPDWFLDAKFGIYCHWGPYSVPAFETEWYSHWMYVNENNPEWPNNQEIYEHHLKTYGTLDTFGYKDFIPLFKAEKFDAEEWAELFLQSGAKFAGPVSEHADGFAMWDSDITKWDAKDMGPKRDVMGELSTAIRKRGMKFVATYHRHWLYAWYPTWDETTDASNPEYAGLYGPKVAKGDYQPPHDPRNGEPAADRYYPLAGEQFNNEWLDRLKEIIDKYQPDLVWFDNKMDIIDEEYRKEFLSYYYNSAVNQNKEVVATYKFHDFAEGTAVLDVERARMSEAKLFPWLTDDSVDWGSWCDVSDPDYKTTNRLIDVFIDIISKNGCLLLNITPRADGVIPQPVKDRLLEMGAWLKVNGEAVYGTRPWTVYGEGPTEVIEGHLRERENQDNTAEDVRFTQKDNVIYAFILDWPEKEVNIRTLGNTAAALNAEIESISMLGSEEEIAWKRNDDALNIKMPEKIGDHAFVFKIATKK